MSAGPPGAWVPASAVLATAVLAAALASAGGTRLVLAWLRHRRILDHPNERSSHTMPTPRGGGLAVTPVAALGLLLASGPAADAFILALAVGAAGLMALSWVDDRRGLAPLPRFLAQGVMVAACLACLGPERLCLGGVAPLWADRVLTGLGWLWFVNLYNFMDGIDGITGVQTTCLGVGVALCLPALGPAALAVAGAGLGFLVWNWHPARIFMGDSGSVPLGFMLGGLLVLVAGQGLLAVALILPLYYVADASITLVWRLWDREPVWQAHRRHFYQRATRNGRTHAQVASAVLACDVVLVGCGWLAAQGPALAGLGLAVVAVAVLLAVLTRWARP